MKRLPYVIALGISLLIFFFHLPDTRDSLLFDDSADYMRAAQSSILSTYLNTNSASPLELMSMRKDPEFKAHPWDSLYANGDNAALRHFHGPVSYYFMHGVYSLSHNIRWQRVLAACVGSLTCAALFLILVRFGLGMLSAAILAIYAGLQSRFVEPSVDPTPHGFYILISLAFLYFFSRALLSGLPRDLYLTAGSLAVAVATLEFSVELFGTIVVAVIILLLLRRSDVPWATLRHQLLRAAGVFLLTSFIVWPGGWVRGGYFENYGVLSATVLFKNKTAFGEHLTAGLIYRTVFAHHPVLTLFACIWIGATIWLLVRRTISIPALVFSIYTTMAFVLGVADHFRLNTYVSEYLIFLIVTVGLLTHNLYRELHLPHYAAWAFPLILVFGCVNEWTQRHDAWGTRPWLATVFTGISDKVPQGENLLVSNDKEALSLYLPQYKFQPTVNPKEATARSAERAAQIHYGLTNDTLGLPPNSTLLATYPTSAGHQYLLWRRQ